MFRKSSILIVSIVLISLFGISPLATGRFSLSRTITKNMVFDLHGKKVVRLAYTIARTTDATATPAFTIVDNIAGNMFDDEGNYIETIYWTGAVTTYTFNHDELSVYKGQPAITSDTSRSSDHIYTDPNAVVINY